MMVVDSGWWAELESPVCKMEGENWLTVPADDRVCSGVSRSLAVSASDLGVMGGHHRRRRHSGALPQVGGASNEGGGVLLWLRLLLLLLQSVLCVLLVLALPLL